MIICLFLPEHSRSVNVFFICPDNKCLISLSPDSLQTINVSEDVYSPHSLIKLMSTRRLCCISVYCIVWHRCQGHHQGDRPPEGARPGPAQAHTDLLHGGAAVPAGARVPAVPVRGGAGAHGAGPAAEPLRDTGETQTELLQWRSEEVNILNEFCRFLPPNKVGPAGLCSRRLPVNTDIIFILNTL